MNRTDIRRVADFLYSKYGPDAVQRAGEHLDWAIANGDIVETRNWMRVVQLISRYHADVCPDTQPTGAAASSIEHGEVLSTPSP